MKDDVRLGDVSFDGGVVLVGDFVCVDVNEVDADADVDANGVDPGKNEGEANEAEVEAGDESNESSLGIDDISASDQLDRSELSS